MTAPTAAGAPRAVPAAPPPAVPAGDVAAAFATLRRALQLDDVKPPTFGALVRACWAAAHLLTRRCEGGKDFASMREERRRIVALALSWAESVALAQTALQLAVRLPPVGGAND